MMEGENMKLGIDFWSRVLLHVTMLGVGVTAMSGTFLGSAAAWLSGSFTALAWTASTALYVYESAK